MKRALVVVIMFGSRIAFADFANNEAIHDHIDAIVRDVNVSFDRDQREALLADRLSLSLGSLVPVFGTYRLDQKVFGGVRPSAVVFDWVLGGVVPLGLGLIALEDGALSPHARAIAGWTAVGLYAATRIGVLIVGNLHVTEYNRYLRAHLDVAAAPGRALLVASTSW